MFVNATPTQNGQSATDVAASTTAYIQALNGGTKWGGALGTGVDLVFSIPTVTANWATNGNYGNTGGWEPGTWSPLSTTEATAFRQALQAWANVANIRFSEVTESATTVGDIRVAYSTVVTVGGWAYYPNDYYPCAGDVWLNPSSTGVHDVALGSGQFQTYLHELGHALGLSHPGGGGGATAGYDQQYTLMSYNDHPRSLYLDVTTTPTSYSGDYSYIYPETPMLYDIAAIQYLYGANTTYHSGNDTYTFDPARPFFMTIWDAGGTDTISVANFTRGCLIDLRAGQFSDIVIPSDTPPESGWTLPTYDGTDNLAIAFGVTIERATGGGGADTLVGNAVANTLAGNAGADSLLGAAGNDTLNGGTGADTMLGGAGSDTYYVDNAGDRVVETTTTASTADSGGTDTVQAAVTYTLANYVENLRLLAGAINGTGNALANTIYAGTGNNVINGGTGIDTVSYGNASAAVVASLAVATAQATGGSGSDTLLNLENIAGSNYNDRLTGNAAANVINGGTGADTLLGGAGDDTYYVDNAGDRVFETTTATSTTNAGGVDIVQASVSHTLANYVENLRLLAAGAIDGTGNALANTIYAGAGNNVINGGTGADTVSYAYAGAAVVASLAVATAQATGGSGADTLLNIEHITGSTHNDRLTGNATANVLDGSAGADTLFGGGGNDTYYVDNASDRVFETTTATSGTNAGGTDLVCTTVNYSLGSYVENLRLLAAGACNGTGNTLANTIYAGAGNNVINGDSGIDTVSYAYATAAVTASLTATSAQVTGGSGTDTLLNLENLVGSAYHDQLSGSAGANTLQGGTGNDTLTGGAGSDIFRFDTALGSTNVDRILDFSVVYDTLQLENAVFRALTTTGTLTAGFLRAAAGATTASDTNDYLIYNKSTGDLYYDRDGSTATYGAVKFAVLGANLTLTNADFVVT